MEYFIIRPAVDTKETGPEYPQLDTFNHIDNTKERPILVANKTPVGELPPDDLNFDYFEIKKKKVKLTDIMSSSFIKGFVVSTKFKKILETCNVDKHKFYPIKIKRNNEWITDYYYLHIASNLRNYIDYRKSKFYVGTLLGKEKYELENIDSYEDLIRKNISADKGELIEAKYLYLSSNFPFQLDLFKTNTFNYSVFISGRLKDKIIENNLTGIDIYKASNFLFTPNLA